MFGNNLLLRTVVHDPSITDISLPMLGTVGDIHVDTIVLSAASMLIVLAGAAVVTSNLTSQGAGSRGQQLLESLYGFVEGIAKGQMGDHHYKRFLPLVAGIFMFVLMANLIGVFPWTAFEPMFHELGWTTPEGKVFDVAAATTDVNCVFGLTMVSILAWLWADLKKNPPHFFNNHFNPFNPHFYLELLDIFIRPSTLTLRLMLVISADETLRAVALQQLPLLAPTGVMAFELFICAIQAFVFAVLTSIYIGIAVQTEHH